MFNANSTKTQLEMLREIGFENIEDLFKDIPEELRQAKFNLPQALEEQTLTKHIKALALKNKPLLNFAAV